LQRKPARPVQLHDAAMQSSSREGLDNAVASPKLRSGWPARSDSLADMEGTMASSAWAQLFTAVPSMVDEASLRYLLTILVVIYIIDHGICHLRHRTRDWRGRWYRWVGVVCLLIGMCCYVVNLLAH
jgi:hypothetical protein